MSIVPAGVHDTGVLGDEVVRIRLLDGKGVHVRAECDDGALAIVEFGDHPRSAYPCTDGEAEHFHLLCRDSRRSDLLERKLRMPMKVSAYRGKVCGERLGLFEKIHGASGVWVEHARSVGRGKCLVVCKKKPRLACSSESIAATGGEFRIPRTEGRIACHA